MDLQNRVAIVTGGAVRIGRAIVEFLAEQGAQVVLHYGSSQDAAQEIARRYSNVRTVKADLSDPVRAAEAISQFCHDEFGHADVLVNNAAIFEPGSLESTTVTDWDRHFSINLKAPFFVSQSFCRLNRRSQQAGQIINIVDWRGTRPVPGHVAYTLTKSALVTMTHVLAQELGPDIRVNAIAPGAILPAPGVSEAEFQQRCAHTPLGVAGSVNNVVQALRYLLSAEFVTGEVLYVSGGEHL